MKGRYYRILCALAVFALCFSEIYTVCLADNYDEQVAKMQEEEAQTHRTRSAAETGKAPKSRMKTSPEPKKAPSVPKEATPEQRRVLELLARGGQNVNAICTLLDMEFSDASFLLTEMELIGWIVNTERDVYVLAGSER